MFVKLEDPRTAPLVVLSASAAVLSGAFAFQYVGGYLPCILCLYQRFPYAIAIALSIVALMLASRGGGSGAAARLLVYACGVLFVIGAGIAFFHVGVEQHWWTGTAECSGSASGAGSVAELEAMIKTAPVVRCDQVAWSLFGISMAGYNVPISLALAAFAFLAPRCAARHRRGPGAGATR
ncbi:MAG: disulfide bond formation protein B [Alphaproteobacteria bacterium]